MMKATLRSAVLLAIVAIGMMMASVSGYAEVQNVRVGGEITVRAFHQENMDLNQEADATGVPAVTDWDDEDDYFMQKTAINIGADLTENVSAFVRIVNERDWNEANPASTTAAEVGEIQLSQAYVTLKELFYSPITLRVGTQPIVWGRGLVLGSNLLPSNLGTAAGDRNAALAAPGYTDITSFDAIRTTVDLSGVANIPASVDYVYIKSDENFIGTADDINIQGVNLSFQFEDGMSSEIETYYLNKRDRGATTPPDKHGSINTLGVRGSTAPVEGASFYGELAYQWGKRGTSLDDPTPLRPAGGTQTGWLANLGGDFTFTDTDMTPKVGAEWVFYSGDDHDGAFAGWEAIAPGYFPTLIRSYQTRSTVVGLYPVDQAGVTSSFTNQHELALYGSLKPIEDLTVKQRLSWFVTDADTLTPRVGGAGDQSRKGFLGTEWDTNLVYDYTEDVQFGFDYGVFFPGNVFRRGTTGGVVAGDSTAQIILTSMSLKF